MTSVPLTPSTSQRLVRRHPLPASSLKGLQQTGHAVRVPIQLSSRTVDLNHAFLTTYQSPGLLGDFRLHLSVHRTARHPSTSPDFASSPTIEATVPFDPRELRLKLTAERTHYQMTTPLYQRLHAALGAQDLSVQTAQALTGYPTRADWRLHFQDYLTLVVYLGGADHL